MTLKILIASDHGGFDLKKTIIEHLKSNSSCQVSDLGCDNTTSVDYTDFAVRVAQAVQSRQADRGILVCGTGIGMAITANKFKGVRAAVVGDMFSARMTREHNDLNVLCLGGRVIGPSVATEIVDLFLNTPFAGGRHAGRVAKITEVETKNFK